MLQLFTKKTEKGILNATWVKSFFVIMLKSPEGFK